MSEDLTETPLYDLHIELGAKMAPFAGFNMPVQYANGVIKEHLHTRANAGLFDVSHMGQARISGAGATGALEQLVPVELGSLDKNSQVYAVFTNENGGILDDLIITRWDDDDFFLVFNAACKEQDLSHLRKNLSASITVEALEENALLALQGPKAKEVMLQLAPEANSLVFMRGCHVLIEAVECYITRSGYTGEDGFEILCPAAQAEKIVRKILSFSEVEAIGLGARDSLRLEAGLCLYGHDMDVETTPVEASIQWSISKSRRADGSKAGGFPGAQIIFEQMITKASRHRVGLMPGGKAPIREGVELVNEEGRVVGKVTSGGFGPSVGRPVAMGYVEMDYITPGTELNALVRGKKLPINVSKLPFVQQRYFRGQ